MGNGGPVLVLVQPAGQPRDLPMSRTGGLNDEHFAAISRALEDSGVASLRGDLGDAAAVKVLLRKAQELANEPNCVLSLGYREGAALLAEALQAEAAQPAAVILLTDQEFALKRFSGLVRRLGPPSSGQAISETLLDRIALETRELLYETGCYVPPS